MNKGTGQAVIVQLEWNATGGKSQTNVLNEYRLDWWPVLQPDYLTLKASGRVQLYLI